MLLKLKDFYKLFAFVLVPRDEAPMEGLEDGVHRHVLVGEKLGFDPERSVLQPPLAVSQGPKANEKQAPDRLDRREVFVQKKVRLNLSAARHGVSNKKAHADHYVGVSQTHDRVDVGEI